MIDFFGQKYLTMRVSHGDGIKTTTGVLCSLVIIGLTLAFAIFAFIQLGGHSGLKLGTSFEVDYDDEGSALFGELAEAPPIEVAVRARITVNCMPNGFGALVPIQSANPGDFDDSSTTWKGVDRACSPQMIEAIKGKGLDPKEFFCIQTKEGTGSLATIDVSQTPPGFMYCTGSFTTKSFCMMNLRLDHNNYENPFSWKLDCQEKVLIDKTKMVIYYSATVQTVETDSGVVGSSKKSAYSFFYELQNAELDPLIDPNQVKITTRKQYTKYARSYTKLQDVFATIGGVFNALLLVVTILFSRLFAIQRAQKIDHYLKKDNTNTRVTLTDYLKARLCCNRKAKEKITRMEEAVRRLEEKLELLNLVKPESDESQMAPIAQEHHVKVYPQNAEVNA